MQSRSNNERMSKGSYIFYIIKITRMISKVMELCEHGRRSTSGKQQKEKDYNRKRLIYIKFIESDVDNPLIRKIITHIK